MYEIKGESLAYLRLKVGLISPVRRHSPPWVSHSPTHLAEYAKNART